MSPGGGTNPGVTAPVPVRGRLALTGQAPLGAQLAAFVTAGTPFARLFPARYDAPDTWARLAAERRARFGSGPMLDPDFGQALVAEHRRLGASARSLAHVEALAEGRAFAIVAGQQPGPLGGPLYSWHKTWTAVALARALAARLDVPVVPVFWNATGMPISTSGDRDVGLADGALGRRRSRARVEGHGGRSGGRGPWRGGRARRVDEPSGSARAFALLARATRKRRPRRRRLEPDAVRGPGGSSSRSGFRRSGVRRFRCTSATRISTARCRERVDALGDAIGHGVHARLPKLQTGFPLFEATAECAATCVRRGQAALVARAIRRTGLVPGACCGRSRRISCSHARARRGPRRRSRISRSFRAYERSA
jgi:hypothetical protein